ncbi:hypothetical protein AJ78_04219 [Emergomyces pasteurianus Ep9510]|uniref:Uncharacterized protein n=1 Tax=Emergomyces pasteurianus Ep9510 TaxID=1447872 RepID=A0A1J9Q5M2_9EURO|nr:hypothetical protein AJ78_04219 [Emergomyces pasteurianus Ep9510]
MENHKLSPASFKLGLLNRSQGEDKRVEIARWLEKTEPHEQVDTNSTSAEDPAALEMDKLSRKCSEADLKQAKRIRFR